MLILATIYDRIFQPPEYFIASARAPLVKGLLRRYSTFKIKMQGEWLVPIFEKRDSNYVRSTNLSKVVFALQTKECCVLYSIYTGMKKKILNI